MFLNRKEGGREGENIPANREALMAMAGGGTFVVPLSRTTVHNVLTWAILKSNVCTWTKKGRMSQAFIGQLSPVLPG